MPADKIQRQHMEPIRMRNKTVRSRNSSSITNVGSDTIQIKRRMNTQYDSLSSEDHDTKGHNVNGEVSIC